VTREGPVIDISMESWTIDRTAIEFGANNYLAHQARKLQREFCLNQMVKLEDHSLHI